MVVYRLKKSTKHIMAKSINWNSWVYHTFSYWFLPSFIVQV